jgi:hypothetical protein
MVEWRENKTAIPKIFLNPKWRTLEKLKTRGHQPAIYARSQGRCVHDVN